MKINRLLKGTLSLVFIFLLNFSLSAQEGWEAGPWAGAAHYFGDLNTNFKLHKPGGAAGFSARYNFNNRVGMKLTGSYAEISADDALSDNIYERARNLSFKSVIVEGNAQLEFNFLPYTHGSKDEFFTPYIYGGIAVFYFNPIAELDGTEYELRTLGTEGQFKGEEYYSVTGAVSFGMGLKMDLSYRWSFNVDLGIRSTFTDYLDDVSTVYADPKDLKRSRGEISPLLADRSIIIEGVNDGSLSNAGRQRGDNTSKDAYAFLGVSLLYYFGDIKCPRISNR